MELQICGGNKYLTLRNFFYLPLPVAREKPFVPSLFPLSTLTLTPLPSDLLFNFFALCFWCLQRWEFLRFMKTLLFFQRPRRPRLPFSKESRAARRSCRAAKKNNTNNRNGTEGVATGGLPTHLGGSGGSRGGVVLVTGSTGGVGRRVVKELRSRGVAVRAMVSEWTRSLLFW